MDYIYCANYEKTSQAAARMVAREVLKNPKAVLGLPTGSTPIGMYRYLVHLFEDGLVSFADVKSFNLDEYVGLNANHPQSYAYFMYDNFFSKIDVLPGAYDLPRGIASDINVECKRYDEKMQKMGGIDLQILGIGLNGHIGFNEPSHDMQVRTHCVDLTHDTIQANARFFNSIDEVPRHAVTMGIGNIMKSRKIILLVSGENKRDILQKTMYGAVSPEVPASILQFHSDVTVITDIKL